MRNREKDLPTPRKVGKRGEGCIIDKMVGRWGPYRYLVKKKDGIQTWKYLGKTSKFTGLEKEEE